MRKPHVRSTGREWLVKRLSIMLDVHRLLGLARAHHPWRKIPGAEALRHRPLAQLRSLSTDSDAVTATGTTW